MDTNQIIKSALKAGIPLLLEGVTGVGKTYSVMKLAEQAGVTLHVVNISGETTVDSLLGGKKLSDGTTGWYDAPVIKAIRSTNDWILFDELNTAIPEVLTVLNGLFDDSRSVTLPNEESERVTANPGVRFIATQNPSGGGYAGTASLNEAFLNRFIKVEVSYMRPNEEIEALKAHTKLKDNTLLPLVEMANFTRNNMDEKLSTRDLVKILRLRDSGGMSVADAIATVVLSRFSIEEYRKIRDEFSSLMRSIDNIGCGNMDPIEYAKTEVEKVRQERVALEKEKADMRSAVRAEILADLLTPAKPATPATEVQA